jgi:lysophospholipase L1-like esterase
VVGAPGNPAAFPGIPWTRALVIGLICFGVWLLLDAPSLQASAEASPFGTRRTVSMDVVGPIAAVSRGLQLSHVVGWTDDLLGRSQGGGPALAVATPHQGKLPTPFPISTTPSTTPGGSTTPTTFPPLNTAPSPANPMRVLVVGDSIGIDLGQALVNDLAGTDVVSPTLDGRIDTGLSRPDYFNWPDELVVDLLNDHPQLVVVMIGANDPQNIQVDGDRLTYGTPAWNAAYATRVDAFIELALSTGAHVLWVGMPPMSDPGLNASMDNLNSIVRSQVALHPGEATFFDTRTVLGTPQGAFTPYLTNAAGAEVNVRTPDGIHLTSDGAEVLSQAVMNAMRSTLHIALPPS